MIEQPVDSIPDFVREVLALRNAWYPAEKRAEIWFRGTENRDLHLLPGAYWRTNCDEESLFLSFQNMAPSYLPREPLDDWEWYYLAQHSGLPTRLLDWTENPLIALFFALAKDAAGDGACVWMLDPVALNRISHQAPSIIVPAPSDPQGASRYWLPEFCGRGKTPHQFESLGMTFKDNTKPIALFPKRANPRIVAQRGVFTCHGIEESPIDELMKDSGEPDRIARFCVPADRRLGFLVDLYCLGISKGALFPEPSSLAEDLKLLYEVE